MEGNTSEMRKEGKKEIMLEGGKELMKEAIKEGQRLRRGGRKERKK